MMILFAMIQFLSGRERPITAIMKASDVPSEAPFSRRAWTIGIIPAAFE